MRRRTLAAVAVSLCTLGAAAPIATASAAPAPRFVDITDGTSNTMMYADSAASPALSLNFTKIEYNTLPR